MTEPSQSVTSSALGGAHPFFASLNGDGAVATARRLFLATRPKFLTASILPLLLGTAIGARVAGAFDWVVLLFALGAVAFVHCGANILNDVFDDMSGADVPQHGIFPYTGGSRFIQNAVMTRRQMAAWGVGTLMIGALFGTAVIALKGPVALVLGIAGIALGTLYTMPPVQLGYRGLGELSVGLAFGPLPVLGAAWLQSGTWPPAAALSSAAVGCWVAAILLINEVPDLVGDTSAGKRTLVVRFGRLATQRIYQGLMTGAAGSSLALAFVGLPLWIAVVPVAASAAGAGLSGPIHDATLSSDVLKKRLEATLAIHAIGTLWLTLVTWGWL
ncbi:MAG: 1,4-dihydroxy-2-naphthoate octaprenyltransferase [Bauldia sp.]